MTLVKICGIRNMMDVQIMNSVLPDYVGFVFARSKRQVSIDICATLSYSINTSIKKVGVFVNENLSFVLDATNKCHLDVIQLHGDENPDYILQLQKGLSNIDIELRSNRENNSLLLPKTQIWKVFRVKGEDILDKIKQYSADAFLLDTYVDGAFGGMGKSFDWKIAAAAGQNRRIILAGGLSATNIKEAINIARPFAVDVSSSVENPYGKDKNKVTEFISLVRNRGISKK
jgi:phosphoribosylanthranilate isomerase